MRYMVLFILFLCRVSLSATFTDVTVVGTPYLTYDVLYELHRSDLARGGGFTGLLQSEIPPQNTDELYEYGEEVNVRSSTLNPRPHLYYWRLYAEDLWDLGWINSIPSPITNIDDIVYSDQVSYFVDAGLSSNGWRNATNYNPLVNDWKDFDDPMYIYRTNAFGEFSAEIKQGDIYGPWLIDDLQRAYDHARYRVDYFGWSPSPTNYYYGEGLGSNTLADAKSAAISDFSKRGIVTPGTFSGSSVSYSSFYNDYDAELRNHLGFKANFVYDIETNSVFHIFGGEMYAYARIGVGSAQFDDLSTGVSSGLYERINTATIAAGTTPSPPLSDDVFGDASIQPSFPAGDPSDSGTPSSLSRGFFISDRTTILKPTVPYTR